MNLYHFTGDCLAIIAKNGLINFYACKFGASTKVKLHTPRVLKLEAIHSNHKPFAFQIYNSQYTLFLYDQLTNGPEKIDYNCGTSLFYIT